MAYVSLQPEDATRAVHADLVVVMPIYNEEANIRNVVTEWSAALDAVGADYQMVLLNDGSRDGTLAVLRELEQADPKHLIVVDKPNAGHGRTCRLGYDIAVASSAGWVLQLDSDGQCDPAYFHEFWSARAEADCVMGLRRQREDGWARTATSQVCRVGASALAGVDLRDPNVPYRLIRREVLAEALRRVPTGFNVVNVAVTYVLKKLGNYRWRYVDIVFRDRQGGTNSIDVARVAQWGAEMLLDLRRIRV